VSNQTDRKNPDDRIYSEILPKARKNTKLWCKGKVGAEHHYSIAKGNWGVGSNLDTCRPSPFGGWWCSHVIKCEKCGKIRDRFLSKEQCPDKEK
jgi:hypothetical protein